MIASTKKSVIDLKNYAFYAIDSDNNDSDQQRLIVIEYIKKTKEYD